MHEPGAFEGWALIEHEVVVARGESAPGTERLVRELAS
jgi:hypothetical protein